MILEKFARKTAFIWIRTCGLQEDQLVVELAKDVTRSENSLPEDHWPSLREKPTHVDCCVCKRGAEVKA